MTSLLDQLDNDHAMLLMYLAGELPSADRQRMEQRLSREPDLRQQLESLKLLQAQVGEILEHSAAAPGAIRQEMSVRRVTPLIKNWIDQRRQASTATPQRRFRIGYVAYPAAVAAALVVGLAWWWNRDSSEPANSTVAGIYSQSEQPENRAPAIFPDDSQNEKLTNLQKIEDEVIRLASVEDDPLGFRTLGR